MNKEFGDHHLSKNNQWWGWGMMMEEVEVSSRCIKPQNDRRIYQHRGRGHLVHSGMTASDLLQYTIMAKQQHSTQYILVGKTL